MFFDVRELLRIAAVPSFLIGQAALSISAARIRSKGLTLAKWKVRLFKAGKIAKLLRWEDERLCLRHPGCHFLVWPNSALSICKEETPVNGSSPEMAQALGNLSGRRTS